MQTMQQQRAKFALLRVQEYLQNLEVEFNNANSEPERQKCRAKIKKVKDEFKSHASALPAMIHINGLGQAAAFYKSKSDTHKLIYKLLSDWLTKPNQPYAGQNDLIQAIVDCDMHDYRLAQAEAQALMDWVKKFAKAYMED